MMNAIFFNSYRSIEKECHCKITEKTVLVSTERHWFSPKSSDDRLWEQAPKMWYSFAGEFAGFTAFRKGLDKYPGGIIVFSSSDINACNLSKNHLINWFRQKYHNFLNRITRNKKLARTVNDKFSGHDMGGFSVGHFFHGRYVENGKVFDQESLGIEVSGVPREVLIRLATEVARDFRQSSVLLRDRESHKNNLIAIS